MDFLAVFSSAFFAATLIPGISEFVLARASIQGGTDHVVLLVVASAGNTLGSVVNWSLGRYLSHCRDHRWFPVTGAGLDRASLWFNRFGIWSLLFAWLPFVGDPLTFAAGILRVPLVIFIPVVAAGKTMRYAGPWLFAGEFPFASASAIVVLVPPCGYERRRIVPLLLLSRAEGSLGNERSLSPLGPN